VLDVMRQKKEQKEKIVNLIYFYVWVAF